jgi:penicillin G amidase
MSSTLQGMIKQYYSRASNVAVPTGEVTVGSLRAGSNVWAVDASKTKDGRAILANDVHLSLGFPPPLYRARLICDGADVDGFLVPGIPGIVAGTNGHVAWGVANLPADTRRGSSGRSLPFDDMGPCRARPHTRRGCRSALDSL